LIDPSISPLPAPWWFIQFFKVLGYTLHTIPMNLWYAGIPVALVMHRLGGVHSRQMADRLMRQMPLWIALGINFGIVPLLFLQLAYYKVFYPATILMAWAWLVIVVLLIPAYYGVYVYASGLKAGAAEMTPVKRAAGWGSAALFLVIGFLFANGLSLTAGVARWEELWQQHQSGGAALGTALNVADPSLWPRWLLMFGLALATTAVWVWIDAARSTRSESADYCRWARRFAWKLYLAGTIWFAAAGSWYVWGTWPAEVRTAMFLGPWAALTVVTALMPGLTVAMTYLFRKRNLMTTSAVLVGAAHLLVLALNATSRQVVQNLSIGEFVDLTLAGSDVQWSPLIGFLVFFVLGVGVIGWMMVQVIKARPNVHSCKGDRR